ncbi:MAG TPA: hypothetical protein VNK45_03410 [Candidatus Acidoferrales bacterium]|nr:hypothetical protein [Candidatus Acidoferrales bacterium]
MAQILTLPGTLILPEPLMAERLNLLSFKDNMRILHLSWIAFSFGNS